MPISLNDVQRGYDVWAAKPHNAKWVRKIDGTPIANDIVVNIFEALKEARATAAEATVTALQEALAKIADLTARCEHDGGFDRESGPVGCNLGDKCLCIGLHPIARDALQNLRPALGDALEGK